MRFTFSLRRLLLSITLIAIGISLLVAAFKHGRFLFGSPDLTLALGFALLMEAVAAITAKKPVEFIIPAVIGALLGLLMIPAT